MTQDMKIAGYTVAELTKLQQAVRQDASKIISNAVATAEAAVASIIEVAGNYENVEELPEQEIRDFAKSAEDNLNLAKLISGISGVEYYLSWDEEYREQDNTMSTRIQAIFDDDYPEVLSGVMEHLEEMEHQSYLWNSSSIGC